MACRPSDRLRAGEAAGVRQPPICLPSKEVWGSGMTYGTSPVKRKRRTKAEIEALDGALCEIVYQYSPVTVRQVFYQAVNRGLVPKDETKGYRVVQRRLVALRESGEIAYGRIVDGTRYVHGHRRYEGLDEFTTHAAGLYRKDYWANAEVNVEV